MNELTDLKELKVITYINTVHIFFFGDLIIRKKKKKKLEGKSEDVKNLQNKAIAKWTVPSTHPKLS